MFEGFSPNGTEDANTPEAKLSEIGIMKDGTSVTPDFSETTVVPDCSEGTTSSESAVDARSPLMQSLGLELGNVNRTDVRTQCRKRQRLDDLIVTTGVLPPPPRRRRLNGEEDHLVPIVEAKQDEWSPDSYLQRGISHGVSHGISASSLSSQWSNGSAFWSRSAPCQSWGPSPCSSPQWGPCPQWNGKGSAHWGPPQHFSDAGYPGKPCFVEGKGTKKGSPVVWEDPSSGSNRLLPATSWDNNPDTLLADSVDEWADDYVLEYLNSVTSKKGSSCPYSEDDWGKWLQALFKRDKVKLNYVVLVVSIRSGLRFVQLDSLGDSPSPSTQPPDDLWKNLLEDSNSHSFSPPKAWEPTGDKEWDAFFADPVRKPVM